MAALVYGATRLTEDLDIVACDMDDNMARLATAFNELDAHSDVAESASVFELRGMNTRWITSAGTVDVLVSAKGPAASTINWRTLGPSAQTIGQGGRVLHIALLGRPTGDKAVCRTTARHRRRRRTRSRLQYGLHSTPCHTVATRDPRNRPRYTSPRALSSGSLTVRPMRTKVVSPPSPPGAGSSSFVECQSPGSSARAPVRVPEHRFEC